MFRLPRCLWRRWCSMCRPLAGPGAALTSSSSAVTGRRINLSCRLRSQSSTTTPTLSGWVEDDYPVTSGWVRDPYPYSIWVIKDNYPYPIGVSGKQLPLPILVSGRQLSLPNLGEWETIIFTQSAWVGNNYLYPIWVTGRQLLSGRVAGDYLGEWQMIIWASGRRLSGHVADDWSKLFGYSCPCDIRLSKEHKSHVFYPDGF